LLGRKAVLRARVCARARELTPPPGIAAAAACRALFNDNFFSAAQEAANFSKDPAGWIAALRTKTLALASPSAQENAVSKVCVVVCRVDPGADARA
jgi:hypothetical protein